MKPAPKASRSSAAPGGKTLITAAACAATLIGWATLTSQIPAETAAVTPATTMQEAAAPAWLQSAPDIPTLPPVATALVPSGAAATLPEQPVAAAVVPPALRDVQAAPAPARLAPMAVARTRSSR